MMNNVTTLIPAAGKTSNLTTLIANAGSFVGEVAHTGVDYLGRYAAEYTPEFIAYVEECLPELIPLLCG